MWPESILHVDMDSFFVEVERLRNPELKNRPVAVGGTGGRGVIASASYEARGYGVRSAQPTSVARKLCPTLVVISPSHGHYQAVSEDVFKLFRSFTPLVEGLSLDEAFLDVSGLRRHFESPVAVATEIRGSVARVVGLPCSVGIAPTKFVAKLASKAAKPNGLRHVTVEDQTHFLAGLPVEALWGVGPATQAGLKRLGVTTVGDLAELPEAVVTSALGPAAGRHLIDLARGFDPRRVEPDTESKSMSVEETFASDISDRETLETVLLGQAQRLSGRLRRSGLAGSTITVKLRHSDFKTTTRSVTLAQPVDKPRRLFAVGKDLLAAIAISGPVRLLGIGASSLGPVGAPSQLDFEGTDRWDRVAESIAEIREKFGDQSVSPARLLDMPDKDPESDR